MEAFIRSVSYKLPDNIQAGLELFGFAAFLITFAIDQYEKISGKLPE